MIFPIMRCPVCRRWLIVGNKCPAYFGALHRMFQPQTKKQAMAVGQAAGWSEW